MNTTISMVLLIGAIIAIIIIFYRVKESKKKKKVKEDLNGLAKDHGCTITYYDFWNHAKLGFDNKAGVLFFVRTIHEQEHSSVIKLSEISKCEMMRSVRSLSAGKNSPDVIDKIGLIFIANDKKKSDVTLEFYNTQYDSLNLNGELQLAEKWLALSQEFLQKD
ncbi:hypothetical protein [Saccharicrinis fermentans]|uniref:Uncharacterized protein n=1 Tax=Saccharicrinis fermentans DSM 9555 = JCM 21142 TaxID=869213 RepID=W7YHJ4_9BACT|nr:hypothetical protein [Saccharicrinis fermentans]GAF03926.1 hypothetical protein JCM21142_72615 [Saccharicrinis fermentans DSM 9555 = JCM 21142]